MKIGDLDTLKKTIHNFFDGKVIDEPAYILRDVFYLIDSAPELGYEDGILSVKNATRRAIELEEAYNNGWSDGFSEGENGRPQSDIRWTDKLAVTSGGDIIDFEGRVVGHINLEDMIGGVGNG